MRANNQNFAHGHDACCAFLLAAMPTLFTLLPSALFLITEKKEGAVFSVFLVRL